MTHNELNINDGYLQLIDNIMCTEEGENQLKAMPSKLRGTERQLLLLLKRNDSMSIQTCEQLIKKVSLTHMLNANLIADKNGSQKLLQLVQQIEKKNTQHVAEATDYQETTNEPEFLEEGDNHDNINDIMASLHHSEQDDISQDVELNKTVIAKKMQQKLTKDRLENLPDPAIQVASGIFFSGK